MRIKKLSEENYTDYSNLSAKCGSLFTSLKWLKLFGNTVTVYSIIDKQDKIIGGFYICTENFARIKFIKCTPFTPSNGLFYEGNVSNKSNITSDQKKLMVEMTNFYNKTGFGILRVSFPAFFSDFQPFIWNKYKVIPNYTYVHDLSLTEGEIFSSFSPEKRNEIKKAEKDNLLVYEGTDYSNIEVLVQNTFKRNRIHYQQEYLNKILMEFSDSSNSFSYLARNDNGILAFSFCLHDNRTAYYLFGGSSDNNKHTGAGSATLWECIKKAKSLGLEKFDFEGSMNPNIEHYFRGFGGDLVPYFTVNKANIFIELALTFFKREYF